MKKLGVTIQDPRVRMPMLALAMVALLAAMWGGLVRLGWTFPPLIGSIGGLHGPLMVCGFLGTLIGLERAVALGRLWAYAAPLCSALGAIILLTTLAPFIGALLLTLGSLGLVAISVVIVQRQAALFTYMMGLGALAWFGGNGLWLAGLGLDAVALWWSAFPVLTIVGERLELSRLLRLEAFADDAPSSHWLIRLVSFCDDGASERTFLGAVALFLLGIVGNTLESAGLAEARSFVGSRLTGLGMIALAAWLLRFDIARRTVRQRGLTQYIAWCLLLGYVWLGLGGALHILYASAGGGPYSDARLHAVFVGFVFSMILGHAPIILPALLVRPFAYSPLLYAPLLLLHVSLALRLAGDLAMNLGIRQWGGLLNVIAILGFLLLMAGHIAYGVIRTRAIR